MNLLYHKHIETPYFSRRKEVYRFFQMVAFTDFQGNGAAVWQPKQISRWMRFQPNLLENARKFGVSPKK